MPDKLNEASLNLRAKFRSQPVSARAEILQAFELAKGKATKAAHLLGVPHRTLLRYLHDDGIKAGVAEIREKEARRVEAGS